MFEKSKVTHGFSTAQWTGALNSCIVQGSTAHPAHSNTVGVGSGDLLVESVDSCKSNNTTVPLLILLLIVFQINSDFAN